MGAPADGAGGVIGHVVTALQLGVQLLGLLDERGLVLEQREDGDLDRLG